MAASLVGAFGTAARLAGFAFVTALAAVLAVVFFFEGVAALLLAVVAIGVSCAYTVK
jgi:hypothetical protein